MTRLWLCSIVAVSLGCGDGSGDGDGGPPATDAGPIGTDAGPVTIDSGPPPDGGGPSGDAGSADAGRPAPGGDPTGVGPRAVSETTDSVSRAGRTIPVTAYVPDGPASPLVLFLPGFQLESSRYGALCERLASHGFVVVRADPPASLLMVSHVAMRDDAVAVLDWAEETLAASLSGDVGVSGHSLGGKVATMVAGADDRVDALLGIDPVNGGNPFSGYSAELPDIVPDVTATLSIAVGFLGETTNGTGGMFGMACAPTDQNFQTFFDSSTAASWAAEWDFEAADHMDFVPDTSGCGFTCSACPDGGADAAAVQAGMSTLAVAFFRRHLSADAAMDAFLTGASVPPGVTARSR